MNHLNHAVLFYLEGYALWICLNTQCRIGGGGGTYSEKAQMLIVTVLLCYLCYSHLGDYTSSWMPGKNVRDKMSEAIMSEVIMSEVIMSEVKISEVIMSEVIM